ncbi:MAG: lysylphosphatidylglycerol synthase transmembrane domain-containing protein [Candidatus Sumerlaeota bacterium]|nr:lysylphosphatidylglycerol synthase transmembrane domain-containing protein [Candidatus Sumerlaeota bacterium]
MLLHSIRNFIVARKRALSLILGVLISIAGLVWAMSGVKFQEVKSAFLNPRLYLWGIPFVVITMISMGFRAYRTCLLLRHQAHIGVWKAFKITIIGFCYNSLLPFRAGEFIRAWLLGKEKGLGFARGLSCLVVERIYDMIMLLACFIFVLWSVKISPEIEVTIFGFTFSGAKIAPLVTKAEILIVLLAAGVLFMLFARTRNLIHGLVRRFPLLPHSMRDRICHIIESFASGLHSVRNPFTVFWVLLNSFILWVLVAASIWVLQFGFPQIAPGSGGEGLQYVTFGGAFAVSILICFAVALPSGPAYFGMFEAGGVFAFLVLGFALGEKGKSLAFSYTLAIHLMQIIPLIILGLFFAFQDHISVRKIQKESETAELSDATKEIR